MKWQIVFMLGALFGWLFRGLPEYIDEKFLKKGVKG